MPSTRPCAAFEPISPDFDLHALVEETPNFEFVVRIHCDMIEHQGMDKFEKLVLMHVILGGKPLVIEGYDTRLERWTFALQWLKDNCGSKVENARDLTKKENVPLTIAHYLNNMPLLTDQWTPGNYKDPGRQRMYLKDIDCPPLWHDKLRNLLPDCIFYLNDSTGDIGGFGATNVPDPNGPGMRRGKGIAKSGDLMCSLPETMRAENMMCYIGHEGTYTPCHREMCASLGQNIMVEASTGSVEGGKRTKPGSSIWFMTETKERRVVAEYWLSRLGHDIEVENHFAQINAWKNAPFKTYVVEQKPGDFILIPPLAPHQVWNRGTRTMKVAWNRTTVETLEMALNEALPNARMVCRDEQYKNKAIVYFTLQKYSTLLRRADGFRRKIANHNLLRQDDSRLRQLEKDFRRLHHMYTNLLLSEHFLPNQPEKHVEYVEYDSNITCSYCRANIFNRFLTCPSCVVDLGDGEKDTYDICMECYAMGRSCACISKLKWAEQFRWNDLLQKHESWRQQILTFEDKVDTRPLTLRNELENLGRKRTLAQICQIELGKRPWKDIKKAALANGNGNANADEGDPTDTHGNPRKKKKANVSEKFMLSHARCHVDCHWEPKWKQAQCSRCDKRYCYGILFRAYDMMPQEIMKDPEWRCPSCRNICGCRNCRTKPNYRRYIPSGTLLGHNTKLVADPRSVESLVDFSYSNISWIQKAGDDTDDNSKRLNKRKKEAAAAKAKEPTLGENYVDQDGDTPFGGVEEAILRLAAHENIPIDPALASTEADSRSDTDDEDALVENPEEAERRRSLGTLPMDPRDLLPEGGVVRDKEHEYDVTEAITYDYPDPDASMFIQPSTTDVPTISGYAPAVQEPSNKINMIANKRKRPKIDDGDRSFNYKKATNPKSKSRKSLIIKFNISTERLKEIQDQVQLLGASTNGTPDVPAPVIGSDIQALNAKPVDVDADVIQKKSRLEMPHLPVDQDDDFLPSRSRNRRKSGMPPAEPQTIEETEQVKRPTRGTAVTYQTYEEQSDDDFDDLVPDDPPAGSRSKLATMEQSLQDNDRDLSSSPHASQLDGTVDQQLNAELASVVPSISSKSSQAEQNYVVIRSNVKTSEAAKPTPFPRVGGKTTKLTTAKSQSADAKALAEAQANRRAKMAAIEWMDEDEDEILDELFDEGLDDVPTQTVQPTSTQSKGPNGTSAVSSQPPSREIQQSAAMPSKVILQPQREDPKPQPKQVAPVISGPKASAGDWTDSSDDEAEVSSIHAGPTPPKWTPINRTVAPVSTSSRGRGAPRGRSRGGGLGRGRGRVVA